MLGLVAAMFMGRIDFSLVANATVLTVPIPFKFGFGFDWQAFIPIAKTGGWRCNLATVCYCLQRLVSVFFQRLILRIVIS